MKGKYEPARRLMTAQEVADVFGVRRTTVLRWAHKGKLEILRTPGNHYRFYEDEVRQLRNDSVMETDWTPPPLHHDQRLVPPPQPPDPWKKP